MVTDIESDNGSAASEPMISDSLPRFEPIDVEHTEYIIRTGQLYHHTFRLNLFMYLFIMYIVHMT